MPTLLTNRKMDPALTARIDATLGRRSANPRRRINTPTPVAALRLAAMLVVVAAVYALFAARRREHAALESKRATLLDEVRAQAESLTDQERGAVSRAEAWLRRFSGPYEGDVLASELESPGAFAATVSRPAIYIRGAMADFASGTRIGAAVEASRKDAFLLCLLDPPTSRAEAALLAKVREVHAGARLEQRTPQVRLLRDAEVGLALLLPAWSERVKNAGNMHELVRLQSELDQAPIANAKQAARARLLLIAMDEPGESSGFAELEGDLPHHVRVGIVDLASSTVLLRDRRRVDPGWISPARRTRYSTELDGCLLALDIRGSVSSR